MYKCIYGFLLLLPMFVASQENNLDFHINSKIDVNKQIKIVYDDSNIDLSEDEQYSQVLSTKLLNDLSKKGLKVNFPQDLKNICILKECGNIGIITKDEEFIFLFISTQSSGGRTTINGSIYQNNKVIGGFKSFRSYWTNNRFDRLSSSIADKIVN